MPTRKRPLILLTNDDGVHAPGLAALRRELGRLYQTVIVAPDRDNSAVSHSLSMHRPLSVKKLKPGIFSVNGTPADCVTLALEKLLSAPPVLILSGINEGSNLGHDISYSGTVSAAKEGTIRGIPSLAFSMGGTSPFHFATAALWAAKLSDIVTNKGLPADCYLNVNVPNLPAQAITGVRITRQGRRIYQDAVQELNDPWGRSCYWIGGGNPSREREAGTDSFELEQGCISITPIHLDLTNHQALARMRASWMELLGNSE